MWRIAALSCGLLVLAGCGGGGTSNDPPITPTVRDVHGSWEFEVTSTTNQGGGAPLKNLLEVNLQQSGASVSANGNQQIEPLSVYPGGVYNLGFGCTGAATASFSGTISGNTVTSTLTFTDGSIVHGTASVNADGTISGTYQGGCPANDQGTITGKRVPQVGGTYVGQLAYESGETDMFSVQLLENSDFTLSITGTDNGIAVNVPGFRVGSGIEVSGTIDGEDVAYLGYLPGDGTLQVWDKASGEYIGAMQKQ